MNVGGLSSSSSAAIGAYQAVSGASSIAPTPDPAIAGMRATVQQQTYSLRSLNISLRNDDLPGAQAAYANLQQTIQNVSQANGGKSVFDANSTVATDFQNLGSALQLGNLSDAQTAFATLRQDMRAARPASAAGNTANSMTGISSDLISSGVLDVLA